MRRFLLAVTFLLLLPCVLAAPAEQDLYDFDHLTLRLNLGNELSIVPAGGSWRVDSVDAELSWFPRYSYRQSIEDVVTAPPATLDKDIYHYTWSSPRETTLRFTHTSLVKTSNQPLAVKNKVLFPISSIPPDIAWYTQEGELIDTDNDIRMKAYKLASGTDDLFEVVYNVADWVTANIEYDLTSLAASASKPSTWVMANREGVCDEMTSLFISMLRSLGIPARFVSGVSYTNLPEFAEPWGGHGWAEVWFPDVGWVPFDVTYGTYGYVDATHLKLKDSLDAGGSSVEFTMLARDANLITKSLDIDVEVRERRRLQQDFFTVTLSPFAESIDLDSYNLVTATVKNNKPYYVSARLQLARTENLDLLGSPQRNVLLKPYSSVTIPFLMKAGGLNQGFQYDFPIKIYAGFRELAATSFSARNGQPSYGKTFFNEYLTVTETDKPSNGHAKLTCVSEPPAAYLGDEVMLTCELRNEADTKLPLIQACIEKECQRLEVAAGEKTSFSTTVSCDSAGVKTRIATTKSRDVSLFALTTFECVDEAKIVLQELAHPTSLTFDGSDEISFTLRKESETLPRNVRILITHDNFNQEWTLEEFLQPQKFSLGVTGQHLDNKDNDVTVQVTYQDKLGRDYEISEKFTIVAENYGFGDKFQVGLMNFERWLRKLLG